MIVTRSRTVPAAPERVWAVVGEPRALARWWPRVERVKAITADGWTTVLRWRLDGQEAPRWRAWAQEIEGTPFAKVLAERRVEVVLEEAGEGTRVTLELRQRGRGMARFGRFMLRRAARRELAAALERLDHAVR